VDVVPVYETRATSPERRAELLDRLAARGVDAVMLTSSSTADSLCELLGPSAPDLLAGVAVASIGPITTATAEKRGLTVAVTAKVSTTAGLVDAMEGYFAGGAKLSPITPIG
jgi:uroporphyrinogen III methyltransferase/synthase